MELLTHQHQDHFHISQNEHSEYPYIHRLLTVQEHLIKKMSETEDIFKVHDYQQMVWRLDECIKLLTSEA